MGASVTIAELAKWLTEHDDYVVMGHINSDGDSIGSCIASVMALRALGKRACVMLPGGLPKMFARFPNSDMVLSDADEAPFEFRTVLALDTGEQKRMGTRGDELASCLPTALMDHHGTGVPYGEVYIVDPMAAATGQMVVELVEALNVPLTKEMADWLYIAVSTDCGQFGYSNTSAATMTAAAKLIDAGVDVAKLTRMLYRTRSVARMRLAGEVYASVRVTDGGKTAWSMITKEMMDRIGALPEDSDSLSSDLLMIDGVELSFLVQESDRGIRFSLRSKEWLDVAGEIARPFGGGGHARAAGCTLNGPIEEAVEKVLARTKELLG